MEFLRTIMHWFEGNSSALSERQKREVLNMLTSMQERMQDTSRAYVRGEVYNLSERLRDNSAQLVQNQQNIQQDLAVKNAVLTSEINLLKKSLRDESSLTKSQMENFTKEYDEQIKNLKKAVHLLSSQNKVDEKKEESKTSNVDITALTISLQNLMRNITREQDSRSDTSFPPNGQFNLPPSNFNPQNPSYFNPLNPPQNVGPGPTFSHPPNAFPPNYPYSSNPSNSQNPPIFQPGRPWPDFQSNFRTPNFGPPHRFNGPNFHLNPHREAQSSFRHRPNPPRGLQGISHARKNAEYFNETTSKQETGYGYRHTNGRRGRNTHKQFWDKRNANRNEQSDNFRNKKYNKESSGSTQNEQGSLKNTPRQNYFSKANQRETIRKTDGNDSDATSTTSGFSTASSNSINNDRKQQKHFNSREKATSCTEDVKQQRLDNLRNQADSDASNFSKLSQASSSHKDKSDKFKTGQADSSKENTKRKSKNLINRTDGSESDFSTASQASSNRKSTPSREDAKQKYESPHNQSDDAETDFSSASSYNRNKERYRTGNADSSRKDTRSEYRRNLTDDSESDFSTISHASSSRKEKYQTPKTAKFEENRKEQRLKKLHRFNRSNTNDDNASIKSRPSYSRSKNDGKGASSENDEQRSVKSHQIVDGKGYSSVKLLTKFNTNKSETENANVSVKDGQLKSNSSLTDVVKVSVPTREQASNENMDLNKKFKDVVFCLSKVNDEPISVTVSCLAEIYDFEDRYGECRVVRI